MNELALFAGIGGGLLGTKLLGWNPICAVEINPYRRRVLLQRQQDGFLGRFPIWDDARTFDGTAWRGRVDVVTAGFPCQPFSVAGRQRGEADERNLWPETIRIIREVGPRFAFLENVPGLLVHPCFGTILGELAESGFGVRWRCLSAAELGAPHRRGRLWIVAHADKEGLEERQGLPRDPSEKLEAPVRGGWGAPEPNMGRVAHGVPDRVERVSALGDAQVPAVVARVWGLLTEEPT